MFDPLAQISKSRISDFDLFKITKKITLTYKNNYICTIFYDYCMFIFNISTEILQYNFRIILPVTHFLNL